MKLELLDATHPEYDAPRWEQMCALSEGGKRFKALVGEFLPMNPAEKPDVYMARKRRAHFRSYTGSIINLYTSWLFAADFVAKAHRADNSDPIELPEYYGRFQEDVNGTETTLSQFMRARFAEALKTSKSYWLIEMPDDAGAAPQSKKEYDDRRLGEAMLKELDRCQLKDWECDDSGRMVWALLHQKIADRPSLGVKRGDQITEVWRYYTDRTVETFKLTYLASEGRPAADTEVTSLGAQPHGLKRVPIVCLSLPSEICVGEQTFDAQLEHFRLDNALSWAISRTAYAMPIIKQSDDEKPPTMGAGYFIQLGPEDDFDWASPPADSFEVILKARDATREEIFRICHQMAQAVDNNAETVGRSADSKEIDAAATRIMLHAYGVYLAKAVEETYETISEARPDEGDLEWSVEGFNGYDTATASSLLANVAVARDVGIPSTTFQREICAKVANALLPEVDPKVKAAIRAEIMKAKFEVSSKPADQAMQQNELDQQADMQKMTLKSQEKQAAMKPPPAPPQARP